MATTTTAPSTGAAAPVRRRGQRRAALSRSLIAYLFLAPFLLLFVLFLILPLLYALNLSLFRDTLVGGHRFVGIENYLQVFGDDAFWSGISHMLLLGLVQVPVMLGLALFFALVLDSGTVWLRSLFRISFFLPHAVPSVIAALIWGYLYGPAFGPFGQMARALHLAAPDFLSDRWMLPSLANIVTWEFTGYNMIILYAALQAVPPDVEEAAAICGAKGLQVALFIKIPLIAPTILLTAIFSVIGTLQLFNEPQLMSAVAPQVIGDHYTPNLYAYALAFTNQEYNYSAAVSFVLGALVVVATYLVMFLANRRKVAG
jgi:multiple sugar transport system permease protein